MSVSAHDVLRVARLAELELDEAELPALTAQMDRIVTFVAQLGEAAAPDGVQPGPDHTPLREDVVNPAPLARPPASIAPEFIDGFFVVPKLGAMEDA